MYHGFFCDLMHNMTKDQGPVRVPKVRQGFPHGSQMRSPNSRSKMWTRIIYIGPNCFKVAKGRFLSYANIVQHKLLYDTHYFIFAFNLEKSENAIYAERVIRYEGEGKLAFIKIKRKKYQSESILYQLRLLCQIL